MQEVELPHTTNHSTERREKGAGTGSERCCPGSSDEGCRVSKQRRTWRGRHSVSERVKKFRPVGSLGADRRGLNPMLLQDVFDGGVADFVAEVGQHP
jgi:hypothetical protein